MVPAESLQTHDYGFVNLDGPRRPIIEIAPRLAAVLLAREIADQLYETLPTPIGVEDGGYCG